ncbi:MAG: iron dicitrate transport regulator FecR [Alphaproteobacteria bacterium]|nr:MAG: iron dicitrate transport regulator FecR [Alphaproteobacteria bacterium]
MRLAQTQPTQAPAPQTPPAAAATAPAQAASDEPIGNVAALTGVATVIRNKDSIALKLKDDIYLNDVVQTAASSSLGVTFNDETTFNLRANSQITIDNYVYEDSGKNNAAVFDIAKGTVAFVAAAVAKTGSMSITTPTASLGIRGTTGLVEVPQGAAATSANNVNIKLYPDADGRVGRIEVNDRAGLRLGALTQGASGFAIRPGSAGARFAAVPLTISPREAQRDQGFVRQVHATQGIGRQIVTEQRAFRRANPGLNDRGNQPRQPGLPRQNGLPGQNRPGLQQPGAPKQPGSPKQPAAPNRQGLEQHPGGPQQPGQPPRPGQNPQQGGPGQPGVQPRQGGVQQGVPGERRPGLQQPGLQNRPALRRPAPPKGKKEKR